VRERESTWAVLEHLTSGGVVSGKPGWQGRGCDMKALQALRLISFALLVATPQPGKAASAAEINDEVNATLRSFVAQNPSARELGRKAAGILVFPSVMKGGLGVGGEYGEGSSSLSGNPLGTTISSRPRSASNSVSNLDPSSLCS